MLFKYYNILLKLNKYLYKSLTLAHEGKAFTLESALVGSYSGWDQCELTPVAEECLLVQPETNTLAW